MSDAQKTKEVKRFNRNKLTSRDTLAFWRRNLKERCINVFIWEGLPFPQHEIEKNLCVFGFTGITHISNSDNKFDCVKGSMTGVTNYDDIFTTYVWVTPLQSGMFTIDKEGVVINATSLRSKTIDIVNYYAILLTQIDLTLQSYAINLRATAMLVADDNKKIESINAWYKAVEDGRTLAVLDSSSAETFVEADAGIRILANELKSTTTINDIQVLRSNLLKDFYNDIGINTVNEKRERLISAEIDTGFNRVLFNVSDMLKQRQIACDKINALFNANVSVMLNPEIVAPAQEDKESEVGNNEPE